MAIYSALTDSSTGILLVTGNHVSAIVFLAECMEDVLHVPNVAYPNYPDGKFFESIPPGEYPTWTWDRSNRLFVRTKPSLITEALWDRSRLAVAKYTTISAIINGLTRARYKVRTGIEFQETVYLLKRMQAERFLDSGCDEKMILEVPFVVQYADFANISLKQAAEDILFRAKLDDEFLSKTEVLRLKYFNQVKNATDPKELPAILDRFSIDCFSPQLT